MQDWFSANAPKAAGEPITPGNIDLYNRPKVQNNGKTSTVYSMSFGEDGKEILVPLADEGRILSEKEAIDKYRKTGKHLGIFDTPENATAYAKKLHEDYAAGKYDTKDWFSANAAQPKPGASPSSIDERSAGQVALDQAGNVIKGIPQAITSIPSTLLDLIKSYGNPGKQLDILKSSGGGIAAPFEQVGRGVGELIAPGTQPKAAPEAPEWAQAAQAGGATLGAAALPKVLDTTAKVAGAAKNLLPANITAPKVNQWMGVKFTDVMHGADPGAQLIKDGLLGATKEQTLAKIAPARKAVGQLMDVKFSGAQQAGVAIDAEKTVLDALQNASKRIGRKTDKAFQGQLSNILDDVLNDYPNLDKLTPKQAHQLKVDIGDSAKWKGSAYEDDLNQVFRDIYSGLNKDIKTNVKGIAADQERWGNLYQAEKSLAEGIAKDKAGAGTGKRPPTKLRQGARLLGKAGIGAAIGAGAVSAGSKLID